VDHVKAAKLIRMLSSSNEGEVLAAARALCRMDIHKVAERIENGSGMETATRYTRPRRTKAQAEIARLSRQVEELQGRLARFLYRNCLVCGEPFVAGRADATTCSPRCRTRLHRSRQAPRSQKARQSR
jgi:hypothetical protein